MLKRVSASTVKWATVSENGVLTSPEVQQIYQPKPKFGGGKIKWHTDKIRTDKVEEGQR